MQLNPKAENLDERWPLECVDMVYVRNDGEIWALVDFFGDNIIVTNNRSVVFFEAHRLQLTIYMRH